MVKYTWVRKAVPKGLLVKQVYGVVFSNEGNILLRVEDDKYKLTGGKPDSSDNSFSDTLKREYLEELNVELSDICYLGYLLVEEDNVQYAQIRMIARIKKINDIRADIDNGKIYQRYMANQNNVKNYLDYKDLAGNQMIDDAIKLANENYCFSTPNDKEYFL